MIKRWLTYGITLLLAFVFYGVYTGYLSLFTLAVVLLFPLFSLLVSLWPMHAARVFEPVLKSRCVAGNRPAPLLHIRSAAPFPLPRVEVEYTAVNTTFGGSAPERKLTVYGRMEAPLPLEADFAHMGILRYRYGRMRVYDLSGLFFRSLPRPSDRDILLLPQPVRPVPFPRLPDGETAGKRLRPKPGGGFAEEHDIREYRAGDPLNAVHWKLSAKLDELLIREPLIADRGELRLLMDLFGSREALETAFGKLAYIGGELLRRMMALYIYFCDPEGALRGVYIDSPEALESFMAAAFAQGFPENGKSIRDSGGQALYRGADWAYFLTPDGEQVTPE